jgi:hypothetical protein
MRGQIVLLNTLPHELFSAVLEVAAPSLRFLAKFIQSGTHDVLDLINIHYNVLPSAVIATSVTNRNV